MSCGATPPPPAPIVVPIAEPAPPLVEPQPAPPNSTEPQTLDPNAHTPADLFDRWQVLGLVALDDGWGVALAGEREGRRYVTARRWTGSELGEPLSDIEIGSGREPIGATSSDDGAVWFLVREREQARLVFASRDRPDLLLPYESEPYRAVAASLVPGGGPTGILGFYAQRWVTLTPQEQVERQARACANMDPGLCDQVSPGRLGSDWVDLFVLSNGQYAPRRILERTPTSQDEQSVEVAASSAGSVASVAEVAGTSGERFRLHLYWFGPGGEPLRQRVQGLASQWIPGIVAQRSDGAVFSVMRILGPGGDHYARIRLLGFDSNGRVLANARVPTEGSSFEGAFAAVECGGALWLITQQVLVSRRQVVVAAHRVEPRGTLARPVRVAELPIPEGAPEVLGFFDVDPMRVGCRGAEAGVAFRYPLSHDPGSGELVVSVWDTSTE